MKKLIYIISMLVLSGCSTDYLDETSKDNLTADAVFNTPEGLATAVTGLYNMDRAIYRNDAESTVWTSLIRMEDITVSRAGAGLGFAKYDNTVNANTSQVLLFWTHYYSIIERANKVIAGGEALGLDNPSVAQAVAEAKCFRARSYWYLFRQFDNIILNTEPTKLSNLNRQFEAADPEDIFDLMYSDLDYAIGKLTYTAANPGRFTLGVARHLKAEIALWRKDYAEAALQADEIITKGPYRLLDEPSQIFDGPNLNHSEAIFVSQWDRNPGGSVGNPLGHRLMQYFIPNFYKISGITVSYENGGQAWGRIFPNPYLFSLYTSNDKRLSAFYKRAWVYDNPAKLPAGKHLGDTVKTNSMSIYFDQLYPACIKYLDKWTKLSPTEAQSFKDIIIYRLAETYLIGAEAHMRLNGANDATAIKYMSKIRERAGLGVFTGPVTEQLIMDEDARELSFEGQRWYTLKRLGKLVSQVKTYSGDPAVGAIWGRTGIEDYHVRWPLPQTELDLMKGKGTFKQNTGYPE